MTKRPVDRNRRLLLKAGVAVGAGLVIGGYIGFGGEKGRSGAQVWDEKADTFTPNIWVQIRKDESVLVRVNHSEIGQGTTTALPMILAEELDADLSRVRFEIAPVEAVYKNPRFSVQMTAASTGVMTSFDALRHAGAVARQMLILAAARKWGVEPSECDAASGVIAHRKSGQSMTFGALVEAAAALPTPDKVELKRPDQYRIIGRTPRRLDALAKIKGTAVFGIDVKLPDLLAATVVHPPVFGSWVANIDAEKAMRSPGTRKVTPMDFGVAVVADTMYQAFQAAQALKIVWNEPEGELLSSEGIGSRWAALAGNAKAKEIYERGETEKSLAAAAQRITAVYELPYQAHATPEPMNCTAHVKKNSCDVWAPTQNPDAARETAARISGLKYEDVKVHVPFIGGGFGRRIVVDYVAEAVEISKAMGRPIKLVWSREEDIQHDFYRPASFNSIEAGLDSKGFPIAWKHRIVGPDNMAEMLPLLVPSIIPYGVPRMVRNAASSLFQRFAPSVIAGKKITEGADLPFYAIANLKVEHLQDSPGVPTGFWRSVAFSSNTFVVESFMDEIAAASRMDPFRLRYELLKDHPRLRQVLALAAEKAGWGKGSVHGIWQGMACLDMHDTLLSCVAEVSVDKEKGVKVRRIVTAVDCGTVINPSLVRSQIEGATAFGLTAALKSAVTIKSGRVEQSNLHDFPLLRMDEMPQVEVHIVASTRPPTGIGEMGVPLVAPAVANALFAATGKRIRRLPIRLPS